MPSMLPRGGLTVFVHIPKTGGTTLHNIMSRLYPKESQLHVKNVYTELDETVREKAALHTPFLIRGHLGINHIPRVPGVYTFTFLRDPVERVISHYFFLRNQPSVQHYNYLNNGKSSIESFYQLGEKKDIDNCLVRYISGEHHVPFGKIGGEQLERALENLHHKIDFFGMQDYYDESLILLTKELNWSLPVYRKKLVTEKKDQVSDATFDFIREANKWDVEFYRQAKIIFAEKISGMLRNEKRKVSWLRLLNKLAETVPF